MTVLAGEDPGAIAQAADRLAAGGLVGMPTETVYGLAARADADAAVAAVFAAKGRPADHPLIVHVTGRAAAEVFAARLPPAALKLIDAFWPGPVTVIVPRRPDVATAAAGGQDSVGLRCPSHPVARALLAAAEARGVPGVAAPSANRFGRVSPTSAAHVLAEFGPGLLVLDGGICPVGIESTIVDVSRGHPVLLRPGQLERSELERVLGEALRSPDAQAPRASGTLASHYAPRARVRLLAPGVLAQALGPVAAPVGGLPAGLAVYSRQPLANHPAVAHWRPMPPMAPAVAHELFAVLRALDDLGASEIWVEQPPDGPAWDGVRDRLQRAAA